jgi:hypothetical protein
VTDVLVVRSDAPLTVTRLEDGLNGDTLSWCAPGASLVDQYFDLILLANKDRSPEMVEWVGQNVTGAVNAGGRYQWRDSE